MLINIFTLQRKSTVNKRAEKTGNAIIHTSVSIHNQNIGVIEDRSNADESYQKLRNYQSSCWKNIFSGGTTGHSGTRCKFHYRMEVFIGNL
jgi:hypothetical protein